MSQCCSDYQLHPAQCCSDNQAHLCCFSSFCSTFPSVIDVLKSLGLCICYNLSLLFVSLLKTLDFSIIHLFVIMWNMNLDILLSKLGSEYNSRYWLSHIKLFMAQSLDICMITCLQQYFPIRYIWVVWLYYSIKSCELVVLRMWAFSVIALPSWAASLQR